MSLRAWAGTQPAWAHEKRPSPGRAPARTRPLTAPLPDYAPLTLAVTEFK
jgi:hypothetical protein